MSETTPTNFDLDEWISGVRATERSVEVYQRGDLVAVAEDLLRRYEVAKSIDAADRSISDDGPEGLLAQIEQCQKELERTRTTWTVRALSPEQIKAATEAAKAEDEDNPDVTVHLLAAAVVKVETGDGRVTSAATPAQLRALREHVGAVQVLRIMAALNQAMSEEPNIQAPFSRRS